MRLLSATTRPIKLNQDAFIEEQQTTRHCRPLMAQLITCRCFHNRGSSVFVCLQPVTSCGLIRVISGVSTYKVLQRSTFCQWRHVCIDRCLFHCVHPCFNIISNSFNSRRKAHPKLTTFPFSVVCVNRHWIWNIFSSWSRISQWLGPNPKVWDGAVPTYHSAKLGLWRVQNLSM